VGLTNGELHVFKTETDKLVHLQKIECRNRTGKYSAGKKVTSIEFMNANNKTLMDCVMVTTNDSRIRFISLRNGKVVLKVKGHKNENFMSRASLDHNYAHAICASEDGAVYMWHNI
jgi:WD40 repeat protein